MLTITDNTILPKNKMSRTLLVLFLSSMFACVCQACEPLEGDELSIESKTYLAPLIVEGKVKSWTDGMPATVSRIRVHNGDPLNAKVFEVVGLGTIEPCIIEPEIETKDYLFFLNKTDEGNYLVVANPEPSTKVNKRKIRYFLKSDVVKPDFVKQIKDRYVVPGAKLTLSCEPIGHPFPKAYWKKDGSKINKLKNVKETSNKGKFKLKFKNISMEEHEGVYECVADNGVDPPVFNAVTINVCAIECGNGGTLSPKKCTCSCPEGFHGDLCKSLDIKTTPPHPVCDGKDCGEYGWLNETSCECKCNKYYSGTNCTEDSRHTPCTPLSCQNGAMYDKDICSCLCLPMFSGITCSDKENIACTNPDFCLNNGTCVATKNKDFLELCYCPDGYSGHHCEITNCNLDCGSHGQRDTQDQRCQCLCDAGFEGDLCDEPTTTPTNGHVIQCTDPDFEESYCYNDGMCYEFIGDPESWFCLCLTNFEGNRCDLVKAAKSIDRGPEDQRKVIVYMTVIFVAFLVTIGFCLICYLRYRKSKETERFEQQVDKLRKHQSKRSNGLSGQNKDIENQMEEEEL